METGQRGTTLRDVRDLCEFYGLTDQVQVDRLMDLARGGKEQGWWQSYDLDYFGTYVDLEQAATSISYYQSAAVPGLLQTPAYTRAVHEIALPKLTSERIDQLIEVRVTRQQLLIRDPPLKLWAILDEAVLHRTVGGPHVMKEQLEQLIEVAASRYVTIQVVPFSAGAHPAMESSFNILNFDGPTPSLVYVEGLLGFMYLEKADDIDRYQQVFEHLSVQALRPHESLELISETGKKYTNNGVLVQHDRSSPAYGVTQLIQGRDRPV